MLFEDIFLLLAWIISWDPRTSRNTWFKICGECRIKQKHYSTSIFIF